MNYYAVDNSAEPICENNLILPISRALVIATAALAVYVIAHGHGFVSPYTINDDVRQQIFWMQQWRDPGLYPNDYLFGYARNYVSWGVIAIYWVGSWLMNPVQFTKVITGFLFVISALLIYRLCLDQFRDHLTALMAVCFYFLFGSFLGEMSGGLPRAFAFPLLLGYLCLLVRDRLIAASVVVLVQSLFIPYIFLLCLATHLLYVAVFVTKSILKPEMGGLQKKSVRPLGTPVGTAVSSLLPLVFGAGLIFLKYVLLKSPLYGGLIGKGEIAGKAELIFGGRYEIMPPVHLELFQQWVRMLRLQQWEPVFAWFSLGGALTVGVFTLISARKKVYWEGFRVFGYLMTASVILYLIARLIPLKLFIPGRYLEYSSDVFYCISFALCLRIVVNELNLTRLFFPAIFALLVLVGSVHLNNIELNDYSADASLYRFFDSTPVDAVIAGPPDLMDNVMTFGRRRAFVTEELSHPWVEPYWSAIKRRTYDFFTAYYSENAEQIRIFCRQNGIDYIVVRAADFSEKRRVYFEPFGSFVTELTRSRSKFALLDPDIFPEVFHTKTIRVVKMKSVLNTSTQSQFDRRGSESSQLALHQMPPWQR